MTSTAETEPNTTIEMLQERVRSLEQRLSDRERELEVYQTVQQAINRQLELQSVLQMIAGEARRLTRCAASAVYLMDGEDESRPGADPQLRLEVISGDLQTEIPLGYRMPLDNTVAGMAVRDRKPYCVQDALTDPRAFADAVQRSNVRSFLIVPLISGDQPVGIISVANKMGGPFTPEDERVLSLLASSVVISLENARLYAQAGELAVINERNRLARELHDAVTQSLFSASLIGDVLPMIWKENPLEGQQRLEELRRLTRGALAEMRTLLLELRPAALENASLPELFRHLGNAFTGRTQIPVEINIEDRAEDLSRLPVPVKVGIYRIAQEALNNIAKHAEAAHVRLALQSTAGGARLEITDDGRGFDPAAQPGGHFGLQIMRERAQLLGGELEVESQSGRGTTISFTWMEEEDDDNG